MVTSLEFRLEFFGIRKLESLAIVWRRVRDSTFSRFDTIRGVTDGRTDGRTDRRNKQTDGHTTTAYTVRNIASRGKNIYKILIS